MELNDDNKYQAILSKDPSYEGIFITAVKTTGIFCRPTCTARKPKRENVEFFSNTKEAILHGYRPCKICKPMENVKETPSQFQDLINEIQNDPSIKIKDFHLRQRGIEPNTLRRWFIKYHGITFHAYQRMNRINTAFKKIQNGQSISSSAYEVGFETIGNFNESFKHLFGVSPSKSKDQKVIDLARIETPLGTMIACAVQEGVCLLEFSERKMLDTEMKDLAKRLNATIIQGNNVHFAQLKNEIDEYFKGRLKSFHVPLITPGSAFQNNVWSALREIPYGQTKSYQDQAIKIGNEKAVRAVAHANGMNRIAIIVPCHRVIGIDGHLTGYAGGLWRKKWLLEFEKSNS